MKESPVEKEVPKVELTEAKEVVPERKIEVIEQAPVVAPQPALMQRPKSPKKFAPLIIDTNNGEKPTAPAKAFQLQINEEPVSQAP